jgi:hypothetical protein
MYGAKIRGGFSASTWFSNAESLSESDIVRTGASYKFTLDESGTNAEVTLKLFHVSSTSDNSELVLANDCEYLGTATKVED